MSPRLSPQNLAWFNGLACDGPAPVRFSFSLDFAKPFTSIFRISHGSMRHGNCYPREVSMGRNFTAILVLLATSSFVFADQKKAEITAVRAQIKELQAEEKATIKAVKAQYESVLQVGRLTRAQLEEAKIVLRNQEKALLALTADTDERKSIREQYGLLSGVLTG